MRIAPLAEVKDKLSSYITSARKSPVLVTKNGRPAALLVSVPEDGDELERFILAHSPQFQHLMESAYCRVKRSGGIKHRDFWGKAAKA